MQDSKLIDIYYALSGIERAALRKFVHSPYQNKREDVKQLLAYLEKNNETKVPILSKERVFSAIFEGETYSKEKDSRLRYVMSFLLKLIEDFLTEREALSSPINNQLYLCKAYRRLRLPKHFGQSLAQARKLHQNSPIRDFDFYEQAYRIEEEEYLFAGQSRRAPENIQELSDMLDIRYIAAKLRQSCLMLSHQAVQKTKYQNDMLPGLLEYLDREPSWLQYPAIALYYYYYRAAIEEKQESETYFQQFKTLLLVSGTKFPVDEMRDFYRMATNYCIRVLNRQEVDNYTRYFGEMFQLYQAALQEGFLLEEGVLSHFTFKNIVSTALQLKEFDWTGRFIEQYGAALASEQRNTYVNFSLSKLRFEQKRYDDALLLLQEVEYDDIFLNLNSKVMQMKIYYELDEYEVLDSFLNSFRTFINRKKQSGELASYHQENYLNIIKFTQKLLNHNPFNKKERAKLKQDIEAAAVTERAWLLEQLKG